jgi:hypothetical protein
MKDSLSHLHLLCEDWQRELHFFKDELSVFKNRLNEVASKNTHQEVLIQVEHFENKFRIMSNNIDELLHDVQLKAGVISQQSVAQPKYIHVKMMEVDVNIQDLMEYTSKDFYETKHEFYKFLSKTF